VLKRLADQLLEHVVARLARLLLQELWSHGTLVAVVHHELHHLLLLRRAARGPPSCHTSVSSLQSLRFAVLATAPRRGREEERKRGREEERKRGREEERKRGRQH